MAWRLHAEAFPKRADFNKSLNHYLIHYQRGALSNDDYFDNGSLSRTFVPGWTQCNECELMMNDMNRNDCLEVSFSKVPAGFTGILVAELAETGFDGFSEDDNLLLAYIRRDDFVEKAVQMILQKYPELGDVFWSVACMPDKNWNELWESNYEPVLIAGRCYVRAPFHPPLESMWHKTGGMRHEAPGTMNPVSGIEIIIEPKMSFGTAHHETTALMIGWLLDEEVKGRTVLDMGCGTGVLAILAAKLGAGRVVAVDNNPWAAENAVENLERNNCPSVSVILGEALDITEPGFDLILANINRNVLVEQMPLFGTWVRQGGRIILSGFLQEDLAAIEICAGNDGFRPSGTRTKNNWVAARFDR